MVFKDRFDAAQKLVPLLRDYQGKANTLILTIPRGGLELGYVLAKELRLPLDVIFIKKIGFPSNPEYAIGAVSESQVFIEEHFKHMPELQEYIKKEVTSLQNLIKQRNEKYRQGMPPFSLENKTVIIVDDGVATGNTLLATIAVIKTYNPKKIVAALPVASKEAVTKIKKVVDDVICFLMPEQFYSVSQFYQNFAQVDDQEAIDLLHKANE
jgi:putative phosphoribosyl transferase